MDNALHFLGCPLAGKTLILPMASVHLRGPGDVVMAVAAFEDGGLLLTTARNSPSIGKQSMALVKTTIYDGRRRND